MNEIPIEAGRRSPEIAPVTSRGDGGRFLSSAPGTMVKPRRRHRAVLGRAGADGRSRGAKKLKDLVSAFSVGINMDDAKARAAVVSTARLTILADDLGDANDAAAARGGPIKDVEYATLTNARDRGFARLNELRSRSEPRSSRYRPGNAEANAIEANATLARHLAELVRRADEGAGSSSSAAPLGARPGGARGG